MITDCGPKTLTERDVVRREREAFKNGMIRGTAREFDGRNDAMAALDAVAAKAFPLPRVWRPREREYRGVHFKYDGGVFWYRVPSWPEWQQTLDDEGHRFFLTPPLVALLADLLANPTEEIGAE